MTSRQKLFLTGDASQEAIARRVKVARLSVGLSQRRTAELTGINEKTYFSMESRGAPSRALMRFFYADYRIDPNFLILGEYAHLPPDVLERLETALPNA